MTTVPEQLGLALERVEAVADPVILILKVVAAALALAVVLWVLWRDAEARAQEDRGYVTQGWLRGERGRASWPGSDDSGRASREFPPGGLQ